MRLILTRLVETGLPRYDKNPRVPDFISKGLDKPAFGVGSRVKHAARVARVYGYKAWYLYKRQALVVTGLGAGLFAGTAIDPDSAPKRIPFRINNKFKKTRSGRKRCPVGCRVQRKYHRQF